MKSFYLLILLVQVQLAWTCMPASADIKHDVTVADLETTFLGDTDTAQNYTNALKEVPKNDSQPKKKGKWWLLGLGAEAESNAEILEAEDTSKQENHIEKIKLDKDLDELDDFDKRRLELQQNEVEALNFIFPSSDELEKELVAQEEFFTQTEREQLLELWRATLARNRTVQFVIRSLVPNPEELEKNNAVVQTLSRAIFVPFYTLAAVADNSLVQSGYVSGARVIGDVVKNATDQNADKVRANKTDMIVMFMLVDEVAERMRKAYYLYREAKLQKGLLNFELTAARFDAAEAMANDFESAKFLTRTIVRNLEREMKRVEIQQRSERRKLLELAGADALESVDTLLKLEIDSLLSDATSM